MKILARLFIVVLLYSQTSFSQTTAASLPTPIRSAAVSSPSVPTHVTSNSTQQDKSIENKALTTLVSVFLALLMILGVILGLTYNQLRNFKKDSEETIEKFNEKAQQKLDEVKNELQIEFKEKLNAEVRSRLESIDTHLAIFDAHLNEFGRLILELSTNIKNTLGGEVDEFVYDDEGLKNKRILWVDDQPNRNEYQVEVFRKALAYVQAVDNVDAALTTLKNGHAYDVVITNLHMERTSGKNAGIELVKKMRENRIQTKVLIFTRYKNIAGLKERCMTGSCEGAFPVTGRFQILRAVWRLCK